MKDFITSATLLFLLSLLSITSLAHANRLSPVNITSLTPMDERYLNNQRQRVETLFTRYFGQNIRTDHSDIETIQKLLDRRLVTHKDTLLNQALGIVLGDLLVKDLNMKWVVYSDKAGRSRALQLGYSNNFLFPLSMISRRTDADITPNVQQLFDKANNLMRPYIKKNPYYNPVY